MNPHSEMFRPSSSHQPLARSQYVSHPPARDHLTTHEDRRRRSWTGGTDRRTRASAQRRRRRRPRKAAHLRDLGLDVELHTVRVTDATADAIEAALLRADIVTVPTYVNGPEERHLNLMDEAGGRVSIYLDVPTAPDAVVEHVARCRLLDAASQARAVVLDLLSPRATPSKTSRLSESPSGPTSTTTTGAAASTHPSSTPRRTSS